MAINLSTDGTALTFMGYLTPPNTIDVSNANTPGVFDPTNPSGGNYFRSVVQVGANGAIHITPINAYSGNNGRAAILANGVYYMAGNGNNGSGTPANVVASEGVQIATPGQAANTAPLEIGSFSITQLTNPATGQPYAADKLGKDNNFRGLTIFNNTLYATKGSGSNGVDTVYQVGTAGTLPTLATAATAPITILPGFPTALAKTAGPTSMYPFGIWFANATTLYVADEGDGVLADAAGSTTAGLQKWILANGQWQLEYVMQSGLNLGQQYTVPNYPASIAPATDGLRNITGQVNSNGTVTIWATTSTVSNNGDQGADPNKLVTITDMLSNLSPAVGASEQFTTVKSAGWGEVLRGVSFTPSSGIGAMINTPLVQSLATPDSASFAPGSVAVVFGQGMSTGYPGPIELVFPTTFGGVSISVTDSAGNTAAAPLLYVSPSQINFILPAGLAAGTAQVQVNGGSLPQLPASIQIAPVAPGLFSLNNSGLAAGYAIRVSAGGTQTVEPVYTINSAGTILPSPINMGASTDVVYLTLYGTGFASAGTSGVTVTVNGVTAPVLYAGPSAYQGVDQVNLGIPASLAGKGNVNVEVTAKGLLANLVQITIQ
jgi:uncharacterized protein (TIGR03437 family)